MLFETLASSVYLSSWLCFFGLVHYWKPNSLNEAWNPAIFAKPLKRDNIKCKNILFSFHFEVSVPTIRSFLLCEGVKCGRSSRWPWGCRVQTCANILHALTLTPPLPHAWDGLNLGRLEGRQADLKYLSQLGKPCTMIYRTKNFARREPRGRQLGEKGRRMERGETCAKAKKNDIGKIFRTKGWTTWTDRSREILANALSCWGGPSSCDYPDRVVELHCLLCLSLPSKPHFEQSQTPRHRPNCKKTRLQKFHTFSDGSLWAGFEVLHQEACLPACQPGCLAT